jgi:hypothetical protein
MHRDPSHRCSGTSLLEGLHLFIHVVGSCLARGPPRLQLILRLANSWRPPTARPQLRFLVQAGSEPLQQQLLAGIHIVCLKCFISSNSRRLDSWWSRAITCSNNVLRPGLLGDTRPCTRRWNWVEHSGYCICHGQIPGEKGPKAALAGR